MKQEQTAPPKIQRAAIYIRVSTAEQVVHGKSLQAQMEYLQHYADEHGMKVVGIYADEGQTARKELKKRKAIHQLLAAVKRDEVDVILFWRMDRWFRSVSDFYRVQDILDAHECIWISTSEPNISMETRDGRLNLNLVLTIGQNEVDTTSERIRFTVDNMITNGRVVWGDANLPLGFRIQNDNGRKRIVKDEAQAPMVDEFFRYFLTHHNKKKTVLHMQETFGIEFSYSMLRTMLTSEFYIGKYRGNENYCPAYLTQEQWADVQTSAKRNIKMQRSGRIYLFTGLMRCPLCGQKLVGTGCSSIINRRTGEKRTYCYYRCNRALTDNCCSYTHKVSQNLIEEYLLENLFSEFADYRIRMEKIAEEKKLQRQSRPPEKIRAELERVNYMYMKERLTFEAYEAEYQRLENELQSSLAESSALPAKRDFSKIEELMHGNLKQIYASLDQEHRQGFWHGIIEEIHLDSDNKVVSVDFL
ncbi:MAG: recombinase family protein [Lachnospiraceae bacterium]|nr:recombinase family protein [Lachnospiraceae bacterium]